MSDPVFPASVVGSLPRSDFVRDNTTAHGPAMLAPQWQALKDICGKK